MANNNQYSMFTQVLAKARDAFSSGRTRDVAFRKKQLKSLSRLMFENSKLICEAIYKDLHKSAPEVTMSEMDVVNNEIRSLLGGIDSWSRPETVGKSISTIFDGTTLHREPFGACLIIGAWNYPLQLTLLPLAGAISAGNTVVIKPSEISAATSRVISELLPRYLDNDCYQCIQGGAEETTELLTEKWDHIFYTGSATVGKLIYQAAAKHLTPVTLELGGKSPLYFDNTIRDTELALRRVVWGKLLNSGQTCVAPDYILCTQEVQERIVALIPKVISQFFSENVKKSAHFCRIVNRRHYDRLLKMIQSSRGRIVYTGDHNEGDLFIHPTVVADVPCDDILMQDEIFGPILPIIIVNTVDEAINFINQRSKPLALYAFTNSKKVMKRLVDETSSGSVAINDTIIQITVDGFPFGGVGTSGIGNYHGKYSFETFSHLKPVLKRNYNPVAESLAKSRFPPYTDAKAFILRQLLMKRNFPTDSIPYVVVFFAGVAATFFWNVVIG